MNYFNCLGIGGSNSSRLLREQMIGILNRPDTYGNTPLHYAKPYPDQSIVKLLLSCGAKIDVNQQGTSYTHRHTHNNKV